MTILGKLQKQPREILCVDIKYEKVIGSRTLQSLTTQIEVPSGMALESQEIFGGVLQIHISGGLSENTYRWVFLTDIVINGRLTRLEDELDVVVLEI
jgi:hypothetical protein